jgi:hypothetical protein
LSGILYELIEKEEWISLLSRLGIYKGK